MRMRSHTTNSVPVAATRGQRAEEEMCNVDNLCLSYLSMIHDVSPPSSLVSFSPPPQGKFPKNFGEKEVGEGVPCPTPPSSGSGMVLYDKLEYNSKKTVSILNENKTYHAVLACKALILEIDITKNLVALSERESSREERPLSLSESFSRIYFLSHTLFLYLSVCLPVYLSHRHTPPTRNE